MKIILTIGSIILPLFMIYIQYQWRWIHTLFNVFTIISIIVFGNIAALSIYQVIKDNTVFMTAIHAIFLNPLFLVTGAYVGVYTIYRLMLLSGKEW